MGLGGTAKTVQKLYTIVEDTYSKLNQLRDQVDKMRTTVDATGKRVEAIERRTAANRVLLEAVAEDRGIDTEEALAEYGLQPDGSPVEAADDEDDHEVAPADQGDVPLPEDDAGSDQDSSSTNSSSDGTDAAETSQDAISGFSSVAGKSDDDEDPTADAPGESGLGNS